MRTHSHHSHLPLLLPLFLVLTSFSSILRAHAKPNGHIELPPAGKQAISLQDASSGNWAGLQFPVPGTGEQDLDDTMKLVKADPFQEQVEKKGDASWESATTSTSTINTTLPLSISVAPSAKSTASPTSSTTSSSPSSPPSSISSSTTTREPLPTSAFSTIIGINGTETSTVEGTTHSTTDAFASSAGRTPVAPNLVSSLPTSGAERGARRNGLRLMMAVAAGAAAVGFMGL